MIKNKFLLLLLFIVSISTGLIQKRTKLNYIINNRSSSVENGVFSGMELEFSTIRIYNSPTEFAESRLFTGSKDRYITYKINKNVWYHKKDEKWELFYDYSKNRGGKINLLGNDYSIVFNKKVNIRNRWLHKILFEPININQSHKQIYLFDCKSGVVAIKTSAGMVLIREDYFAYPLTSKEMNLF